VAAASAGPTPVGRWEGEGGQAGLVAPPPARPTHATLRIDDVDHVLRHGSVQPHRPTVRGTRQDGGMTSPGHGNERPQQVVVVGPDGQPIGALPMPQGPADDGHGESIGDMVEQPAKVMRIGTMIKQLLEEVRAAP